METSKKKKKKERRPLRVPQHGEARAGHWEMQPPASPKLNDLRDNRNQRSADPLLAQESIGETWLKKFRSKCPI